MNTKHLKTKILDLAIRGKLVPQDPSEGNAADLLKKIREEKNILIEQKKIKADKNSSFIVKAEDGRHYEQFADGSLIDIEDEIPFEIPENWCWCRLGSLISIKSGDFVKVGDNQVGEYPIYGGNGINGYTLNYNINEKTIIIGRVGFYCGSIHLTAGKAWITDNAFITNFDSNILDIKYLYHLLCKLDLRSRSNSTAQPVVSGRSIYPLLISLPPLSEQKRIVSAIEKAFEQIDIIEKNKLNLKTYIKQTKSKVLDLALRGKLVEQNPGEGNARDLLDNSKIESDDIPFEIPKSWCWCKLDEIGETNIGLTYHPQDISADGIPVLRSNNINNNKLVLNDLVRVKTRILNNQYVKNGDILICARNGSKRLIGKCTILENLKEEMSFGAFMAIFRSNYNQYILRYLQSQHFKNYLRNSNSTQINQITQIMLKNCPLPLPPLYEQKRIVERIDQIFKQLDILEKSLGE